MTSADVLLHPVRLRIVQAFLGDRALTTSALRDELADVPPASLYRHVARLVDAGVLMVVAERRVRGGVERTYVLRAVAARMGPEEIAAMSVEDHRHAFMAFVAGLLDHADRYLARGDVDPMRDGATYQLAGMWLDDAEFAETLRDLVRVLQPRLANMPRPGRRRRILATVLLPGEKAGEKTGENAGEKTGEKAGEKTGEKPREKTGEKAGEKTGEKAGEDGSAPRRGS